jgi:hypothetical protein
MVDDEVWKQIESFPGYAISTYGRVVNLMHDRPVNGSLTANHYLKVTLRDEDGHSYQQYVHQLVAQTFFSGWRQGIRVRHLDGNRSNNSVTNLSFMGGVYRLPKRIKFSRITSQRVRIVETGEVFRTVYDCADYLGGSASNIYRVLRGERYSHLGYTFEYMDQVVNRYGD